MVEVKIILEEVKCPLCQEIMLLNDEKGWDAVKIKGNIQVYECYCECGTKISLNTDKLLNQTLIAKN